VAAIARKDAQSSMVSQTSTEYSARSSRPSLTDARSSPTRGASTADTSFLAASMVSDLLGGRPPWQLVTDQLRSYPAAHREVFPSVKHRTGKYENNRAEVSHQHTREQERQMRRFKSVPQLQRFLHVHGAIQNLFRVGRHQLKAVHHRLRERAFSDWKTATCAC
jgi:transposase-like protein